MTPFALAPTSGFRPRLRAAVTPMLALALVAAALAGCSQVDVAQARLCERVARLVFSAGAVTRVESGPAPGLPHGILTRVTLRAPGNIVQEHTVSCAFAGGAFSPDRLKLTRVSTDAGGPLSAIHMALLLFALGLPTEAALPTPAAGAALHLPLGAATLYFLQQLVNGLTLGCVVALIAVGYTLVYSIIGAINFAFGELYMIGAFTGAVAIVFFALMGIGSWMASIPLALLVAMAINAGYGWVSERLVFRPLREANALMPLIAAIGLSIVLENYVFVAQGGRDIWLPPVVTNGVALAEAGGFSLYANRQQGLFAVITLLLVAATWYLLARTPFGRAQRASSQDKVMAALVGINIDRVIAGTFALGGALAAAGGLMVASYYSGINFVMGFLMGFKALTAAIVGGMGSFPGALLGGFIVALVETFWSAYLQTEYRDIGVFSLLIILLVFRPQGLLGER